MLAWQQTSEENLEQGYQEWRDLQPKYMQFTLILEKIWIIDRNISQSGGTSVGQSDDGSPVLTSDPFLRFFNQILNNFLFQLF